MKPHNDLTGGLFPARGKPKPLRLSARAHVPHAEARHQEAFFDWIRNNAQRAPVLKRFRHIPNGGYRGERVEYRRSDGSTGSYNPAGLALQRQGVLPGTLDNFNPVARRGCHGLWIELKVGGGALSRDAQADWDQEREREALISESHCVHVCWDWVEAALVSVWYFDLDPSSLVMPSKHNPRNLKRSHNTHCACDLQI